MPIARQSRLLIERDKAGKDGDQNIPAIARRPAHARVWPCGARDDDVPRSAEHHDRGLDAAPLAVTPADLDRGAAVAPDVRVHDQNRSFYPQYPNGRFALG